MTTPDFSTMLDRHLLAQNAAEGDREISGGKTWRASRLGSCLRQQYLEFFLKQPKIDELSALSLRRFEVGHQWGRQFATWFADLGFHVEQEVEFVSDTYDMGCHVDFLLDHKDYGPLGVELKSVNSRWFWHQANQKEENFEHMMQAAACDLVMRDGGQGIPWVVLTVSKDDLTMQQDMVTEDHRYEAAMRINRLNYAVGTGRIPECTCLDSWHWRYCGYYEGDRVAAKKKGAKPDGACCVAASS